MTRNLLKRYKMPLTKGELYKIEKRVDEIESTLEICHEIHDADVIENLLFELDEIVLMVENSLKEIENEN